LRSGEQPASSVGRKTVVAGWWLEIPRRGVPRRRVRARGRARHHPLTIVTVMGRARGARRRDGRRARPSGLRSRRGRRRPTTGTAGDVDDDAADPC
jgi:hypothetical protein